MDQTLKQRVFDAAMAEMLAYGLDDFSLDRVAHRAGTDLPTITGQWGDRRVLLMDTMISRAAQAAPVPDTGTLRGDLLALANAVAGLVATPEGRRWFHRMLPHGRDLDVYEVGADFWEIRFTAARPILDRAARRGELRPDLDLDNVVRMFAATCSFSVTFHDAAPSPEFLTQAVDLFVRGVTR